MIRSRANGFEIWVYDPAIGRKRYLGRRRDLEGAQAVEAEAQTAGFAPRVRPEPSPTIVCLRCGAEKSRKHFASSGAGYRKRVCYSCVGRTNGAVKAALKRGEMFRPSACVECGIACRPHAHHGDYTKPLEVEWLCSKCHGARHAGERNGLEREPVLKPVKHACPTCRGIGWVHDPQTGWQTATPNHLKG